MPPYSSQVLWCIMADYNLHYITVRLEIKRSATRRKSAFGKPEVNSESNDRIATSFRSPDSATVLSWNGKSLSVAETFIDNC